MTASVPSATPPVYPAEGVPRSCRTCREVTPTRSSLRWTCPHCKSVNWIPYSEREAAKAAYPPRRALPGEAKRRILAYLVEHGPTTKEDIAENLYVPSVKASWYPPHKQRRKAMAWPHPYLQELEHGGLIVYHRAERTWEAARGLENRTGKEPCIPTGKSLRYLRSCQDVLVLLRVNGPMTKEGIGAALYKPEHPPKGHQKTRGTRQNAIIWVEKRLHRLAALGKVEENHIDRTWSVVEVQKNG
jgi:phage FluMu protein Com